MSSFNYKTCPFFQQSKGSPKNPSKPANFPAPSLMDTDLLPATQPMDCFTGVSQVPPKEDIRDILNSFISMFNEDIGSCDDGMQEGSQSNV